MKKSLLIIASLLTFLLPASLPATTRAVDIFPDCNQGGTLNSGNVKAHVCNDINSQNNSQANPIISTLKVVINIISLAIGVASVIILIISGLRMVIDGGDPNAAVEARNGIIYALAGIAVTIMAQAIVVFVLKRVG